MWYNSSDCNEEEEKWRREEEMILCRGKQELRMFYLFKS